MRSVKSKLALLLAAAFLAAPGLAQDQAEKDALANMAGQQVQPASTGGLPADAYKIAAKKLFGRQKGPANIKARAIGSYAKGCLAGAKAVPINGEAWQVMRLSRNRNWATPT